jgi:hypothetical protein
MYEGDKLFQPAPAEADIQARIPEPTFDRSTPTQALRTGMRKWILSALGKCLQINLFSMRLLTHLASQKASTASQPPPRALCLLQRCASNKTSTSPTSR